MNYGELEKEGERLHQQYLADLEKASPEQRKQASEAAAQHNSEYGCSFASILHEIVKG